MINIYICDAFACSGKIYRIYSTRLFAKMKRIIWGVVLHVKLFHMKLILWIEDVSVFLN